MEKALEGLESHKEEVEFSIRKTAERYGLLHATLQRKYNQRIRTNAEEAEHQKNLTTQQEEELATYIQDLTSKGLPPTRSMLQNYASVVTKKEVGVSWVSRFLDCNKDNLLPRWTTSLNSNCFRANSYDKYKLNFDILQGENAGV
jgi:methylase of polypeptide subunit release factors